MKLFDWVQINHSVVDADNTSIPDPHHVEIGSYHASVHVNSTLTEFQFWTLSSLEDYELHPKFKKRDCRFYILHYKRKK